MADDAMVLQGGQDTFCEGGDGLVDESAVGAEVALEADAEVFSLGVIAGKCANDGMTVIAGESGDEAVAPVDGEDNGSNVLVGIEGDTAFTVAQVKAKITHNSPHWIGIRGIIKRRNTRKGHGEEAKAIARKGQGRYPFLKYNPLCCTIPSAFCTIAGRRCLVMSASITS